MDMDHIPVSKRGEVLLMKRMEFLEPSAPPFSAAKRSYESYFEADLSTTEVEALDELFQLVKGCAGSLIDPGGSQGCHIQNVAPSWCRSGRERPLLYLSELLSS
jgi:hypothetical protein